MTSRPRIALVAAVAANGVIGRAGELVWREPADQKHLRAVTIGAPVIMGRKTWDSLPERFRPLPGRRNVVITRQPGWQAAGAERAQSLHDALALVADAPRASVIGGGEIYAEALPLADELVLTEIRRDIDGDTHFPTFGPEFVEVERVPQQAADGTRFDFVTYRRRG